MSPRLEHLPADALELDPLVRQAFGSRPTGPGHLTVPGRVEDVPRPTRAFDTEARARIVETLETQLAPFEPHVAALDAVRSLAQPGASCVWTRLRPGLAMGTLDNLWRALHTVRLARALTRYWERPVVPLVWVDDDALDGERSIAWLDEHFHFAQLSLSSISADAAPLGRIVLDEGMHRMGALDQHVRQLVGHERWLELTDFLPAAGESFAGAASRALLALVAPQGAAVVQTSWFRDDFARALGTLAADDIGAEPVMAPFAYELVDGARALRFDGEVFRYDDEPGSRTGAELAAELLQDPARFGLGEATRAAVFARAFPAAVHVGTAAELSARCSAGGIERASGAVATPIVPALVATWTDPATRQSMETSGVTMLEFLRAADRPVVADPSPEVVRTLRAIGARAREELLAQRPSLAKFDKGLGQQLRRTAARVQDTVDELCGRADRLHQNRTGKARRHERRLVGMLTPRGGAQQHTLCVLQTLACHGRGWIDDLVDELDPFPTEHLAVHFA